jgi:hypothetical protein
MRRGWKRVAEWADNQAFEREEIENAIIPALKEDCSGEISQEFVSGLRRLCAGQEGLLFKNDVRPQIEGLRRAGGYGLGRVVVEYAIQLSTGGTAVQDIPLKAMTYALNDRIARCARQVEEHYCRESTERRGNRVRERIEQATDSTDVEGLARQILNPEPEKPDSPPVKREGLDDGVRL